MRCTTRGFHKTPPFATALIMRAICIGVTSTAPWPIDMFRVSPPVHARDFLSLRGFGSGMRPILSVPSSIPVGAPSPNAFAYFAMAAPPIFSPCV